MGAVQRARSIAAALLAAVTLLPALAQSPAAEEDPRKVIQRVSAEALTIPRQAEAMARLAWPDGGERQSPRLAAAARERLVNFGHYGLPALRASLARVDKLHTADVTAAFIAARWRVPAGDPADYLPGLVDALWFGSIEARRLAMLEVSRFSFSPAVAPIIDAAQTHPELMPVAIYALGQMRDPRGRYFVEGVVLKGPDRYRQRAAQTLASLGDTGLEMLRKALSAPDAPARAAALDALLPAARPDDLTALYEYLDRHGSDDPERAEHVRVRAAELEAEWEQKMAEAGS